MLRRYTHALMAIQEKEIAEVIATLPEEDIMAMHDVFGPRLEKLCYRSSSLESNRERISNQVLDYIEEKLATNYIRVIKYCTNCRWNSFRL